ncbi:hypothetical protein Y1Q_0024251 [Alligator mississippiensis]|uniref:Uncharacterized protein n=1 Tax=Alligator mississippiensis TaxID=8496 RepID=A0A151NIB1_ALLMI|nr:hypothetical protein Y1Q_0024251 [Alligator mississippiensis]
MEEEKLKGLHSRSVGEGRAGGTTKGQVPHIGETDPSTSLSQSTISFAREVQRGSQCSTCSTVFMAILMEKKCDVGWEEGAT